MSPTTSERFEPLERGAVAVGLVLGVMGDQQLALAMEAGDIDAATVRRLVVDQHDRPVVVINRGVLVVKHEHDPVIVLRHRLLGTYGRHDREPVRVGLDRSDHATGREGRSQE